MGLVVVIFAMFVKTRVFMLTGGLLCGFVSSSVWGLWAVEFNNDGGGKEGRTWLLYFVSCWLLHCKRTAGRDALGFFVLIC